MSIHDNDDKVFAAEMEKIFNALDTIERLEMAHPVTTQIMKLEGAQEHLNRLYRSIQAKRGVVRDTMKKGLTL